MTCACGSGEHDKYTGLRHCVEVMAKQIAVLEAKSAVPPQPAPKLDRQLAPGWVRAVDRICCHTCPGDDDIRTGYVKYVGGYPSVGVCDDCAESAGAFATLASAESPGVADSVWTRWKQDDLDMIDSTDPTPPVATPTLCKDWCGLPMNRDNISCNEKVDASCYGAHGQCLCSPACRDAGRPLNPRAFSKTETTAEPQPAAAPAPVTREAALRALSVLHRETMSGRVGHDWHASYVEVDTFIRERKAREAELEAEAEALKSENKRVGKMLDTCSEVHSHNVRLKGERDALREDVYHFSGEVRNLEAMLAAERAKSAAPVDINVDRESFDDIVDRVKSPAPPTAFMREVMKLQRDAPAPGGTNRERAEAWWRNEMGCMEDGDIRCAYAALVKLRDNPPCPGCVGDIDALAKLLDDVARDAESRGRNAARGEAVKAWRALSESERRDVLDSIATIVRDRDEVADVTVKQVACGYHEASKAHRIARAALAELAGTGGGK